MSDRFACALMFNLHHIAALSRLRRLRYGVRAVRIKPGHTSGRKHRVVCQHVITGRVACFQPALPRFCPTSRHKTIK